MRKNLLPKLFLTGTCLLSAAISNAQLAPIAVNDNASVLKSDSVSINVLNNDTDPNGNGLTIFSYTQPAVGTLRKNADNTFTYFAPGNYSGTVTFTYVIRACNVTAAPVGHSYQFVSAPGISWMDARDAAASMIDATGRQGYLATITSEAENILAYAATQFTLPNGQPYGHPSWLGGSDAEQEGVWKWVTGPEAGIQFSGQDTTFQTYVDGFLPQLPCAYHKWAQFEPNQNHGEEDYLHLQGQNYWNDLRPVVNAGDIDGYLVEFGGLEPGSPSLFDTATVTITVIGCTTPVPTPTITVKPTNTTYTGGIPTNIYIGYGPQSVKLTANKNITSGYTYSWSPATGLSATNVQAPIFTATTPGVFTFTVTATNASGCSATNSVTICVKDIRDNTNYGGCGGSTPRVYYCHKVSGCGGSYWQSYSVPTSQVASYLSCYPNDRLGLCSQTCGSSARLDGSENIINIAEGSFELRTYPNPSHGSFTIDIPQSLNTTEIKVTDVFGKVVARKTVAPFENPQVKMELSNAAPGMYVVEVISGEQHYNTKVSVQ